MAIDLKKMRNKLDKLEGKGRTQSVFWKPQDGDQTIRILPMPDGDPFREMWFHYNLGENRGFLSPKKNFGEDGISKFDVRFEHLGMVDPLLQHQMQMSSWSANDATPGRRSSSNSRYEVFQEMPQHVLRNQ